MPRLARPSLALFAVLTLSSCTLAGSDSGPPIATPLPQAARAPAADVRSITALLQQVSSNYAAGDFGAIRAEFTNRAVGRRIVSRLLSWDSEGARPLHIALVALRRTRPGSLVGTVSFSSDPRAIPEYEILAFRRTARSVTITGEPTGITGTTDQTATWSVTRSAHFTVYHSPYQLAGADRQALARLEHQRSLFAQRFGVRLAPLTIYYLYPQQPMMKGMTHGACGKTAEYVGCADPYHVPPAIHTSEWPSYHEPIHIYELALVPPPSHGNVWVAPLFLAEGTAVALEDRWLDPRLSDYCSDLTFVPLDTCAGQVAGSVDALSLLSDKGFLRGDIGTSYLIGGSFVKYLILQYGYMRFGTFYHAVAAQPSDRQSDYDVAANKVYHRSIARLLGDWHSALCGNGC